MCMLDLVIAVLTAVAFNIHDQTNAPPVFIAPMAQYLSPERREVIMTESLMWMMTRREQPARS